jgi:hypothetical protein
MVPRNYEPLSKAFKFSPEEKMIKGKLFCRLKNRCPCLFGQDVNKSSLTLDPDEMDRGFRERGY